MVSVPAAYTKELVASLTVFHHVNITLMATELIVLNGISKLHDAPVNALIATI